MPPEIFFDYLGVRLNADRAAGRRLVLNWTFPDLDRRFATTLDNCALTWSADRHRETADATVTLAWAVLARVVLRELSFAQVLEQTLATVDGDAARVTELFGLLDDFALMFPVVEPRPGDRPGRSAQSGLGPTISQPCR
jgi:alkyl sulfatase BDS1-like metallo-beta-lactamase superfamily hydrolase